jgi:hypothetical protein
LKKSIQALVLTAVLLAPTAAMAGEFEITPFLGYQFGGDLETFYQGEYHDVNINSTTSYCDPFWCYGYNNSLYQFDVSAGLIIRFGD